MHPVSKPKSPSSFLPLLLHCSPLSTTHTIIFILCSFLFLFCVSLLRLMCTSREAFSEKAEILRLISSCKNGWKHQCLSALTVPQSNSLGSFTDMLLSSLCMISLEAVSIRVVITSFHCMHLVCVELLGGVFLLAVSGLSFALRFVCFSLCGLMIFSFCVDFGEVVLRFAFLHV